VHKRQGKWDIIHFNFGIHDRATHLEDYAARLEQIAERLQQTGAKVVWATTTPIPDDPAQKQTAASIVARNAVAREVMQRRRIAIDDLFAAITPRLAELQNPRDVHFNPAGYAFLGAQVAAALRGALVAPAPGK
jgi:lysophospholipase L1-like esterase